VRLFGRSPERASPLSIIKDSSKLVPKASKAAQILTKLPFINSIEREGEEFFQTGRLIVQTLAKISEALKNSRIRDLNQFYSAKFGGTGLGLTSLSPASDKDGVQTYTFQSGRASSKDAAICDWFNYIKSFDDVHEISLNLHRFEKWDATPLVTTVRFEHIGTEHRATHSIIDRAYFRMEWERSGDSLQILSQGLVSGERVSAQEPLFVDVARHAGIDFRNQYYPPFLNEPLQFGMIRYGPAGIAAIDYDNDGLCDLFIPDGVESKLFRNRGDGTFEDVTEKAAWNGNAAATVFRFSRKAWLAASVSALKSLCSSMWLAKPESISAISTIRRS